MVAPFDRSPLVEQAVILRARQPGHVGIPKDVQPIVERDDEMIGRLVHPLCRNLIRNILAARREASAVDENYNREQLLLLVI